MDSIRRSTDMGSASLHHPGEAHVFLTLIFWFGMLHHRPQPSLFALVWLCMWDDDSRPPGFCLGVRLEPGKDDVVVAAACYFQRAHFRFVPVDPIGRRQIRRVAR